MYDKRSYSQADDLYNSFFEYLISRCALCRQYTSVYSVLRSYMRLFRWLVGCCLITWLTKLDLTSRFYTKNVHSVALPRYWHSFLILSPQALICKYLKCLKWILTIFNFSVQSKIRKHISSDSIKIDYRLTYVIHPSTSFLRRWLAQAKNTAEKHEARRDHWLPFAQIVAWWSRESQLAEGFQ